MNRLHIDFAPASLRRSLARMHPAAWLAGTAALAFGGYCAVLAVDLANRRDALDADLRRAQAAQARQADSRRAPPPVVIPEPRARAVNNAVAQLNLPWRDVFDAVESATPATIALVALEPDAARQLARGAAEARTSEAMIAYIEDLKRQPFFQSVVLTRHEVNAQDPNRPIRFQFEALWGSAP